MVAGLGLGLLVPGVSDGIDRLRVGTVSRPGSSALRSRCRC